MSYLGYIVAQVIEDEDGYRQLSHSAHEELRVLFQILPMADLWLLVNEINEYNLKPNNVFIRLQDFSNELKARGNLISDLLLAEAYDCPDNILLELWNKNNICIRHKCLKYGTKFLPDIILKEILEGKYNNSKELMQTIFLNCNFQNNINGKSNIDKRLYKFFSGKYGFNVFYELKNNNSTFYHFFNFLQDLEVCYITSSFLKAISINLLKNFKAFSWYHSWQTNEKNNSDFSNIPMFKLFQTEWIEKLLLKWKLPSRFKNDDNNIELLQHITQIILLLLHDRMLETDNTSIDNVYVFFENYSDENIRKIYYQLFNLEYHPSITLYKQPFNQMKDDRSMQFLLTRYFEKDNLLFIDALVNNTCSEEAVGTLLMSHTLPKNLTKSLAERIAHKKWRKNKHTTIEEKVDAIYVAIYNVLDTVRLLAIVILASLLLAAIVKYIL